MQQLPERCLCHCSKLLRPAPKQRDTKRIRIRITCRARLPRSWFSWLWMTCPAVATSAALDFLTNLSFLTETPHDKSAACTPRCSAEFRVKRDQMQQIGQEMDSAKRMQTG